MNSDENISDIESEYSNIIMNYNEEIERKWMETDILEYEKNKYIYDNDDNEQKIFIERGQDKNRKIIIISYFHYDTQMSDIEIFNNKNSAKEWLYNRWSWILDEEVMPPTLEVLILLCYEKSVFVEKLEKDYESFLRLHNK